MNTQIKYFGMIGEKIGKSEEQLDFTDLNKPLDLHAYFENRYPELTGMTYQVAVNQEFMTHLEINIEVSEVALLPPFAGG